MPHQLSSLKSLAYRDVQYIVRQGVLYWSVLYTVCVLQVGFIPISPPSPLLPLSLCRPFPGCPPWRCNVSLPLPRSPCSSCRCTRLECSGTCWSTCSTTTTRWRKVAFKRARTRTSRYVTSILYIHSPTHYTTPNIRCVYLHTVHTLTYSLQDTNHQVCLPPYCTYTHPVITGHQPSGVFTSILYIHSPTHYRTPTSRYITSILYIHSPTHYRDAKCHILV